MAPNQRSFIDSGCPLGQPLGDWLRRLIKTICLAGFFAGIAFENQRLCVWADEPSQETFFDRVTAPLVRQDLRVSSAASCSATACHGGPRAGTAAPAAERGSEYPLWLERDPHARSWGTLCQPQSTAILQRLNIMRADQIVDKTGFDNCLACHNTTREFNELRSAQPIHEGVGCASCHGPSEKWEARHFQAGWNAASAIGDGFVPTHDLLVRARMCAACHVGDRDRDMNHDLIAAGHPPLLYEFTTYHLRQPKHWRDEAASDTGRYEASLWLAGQLANLDASLVLLETRAGQRLPVSQWPEFSQLDCSACHQPVQSREPAEQRLPKLAATAALSEWNTFGLWQLLEQRHSEGKQSVPDQQLSQALEALRTIMQKRGSTSQQSQHAARTARLALDAWITSAEGVAEIEGFTAERLKTLAISAASAPDALHNWDRATQFYLAAVAARRAWATESLAGTAQNSQQRAEEMRRLIQFRTGINSPPPALRSFSESSRRELNVAISQLLHVMQNPALPTPESVPGLTADKP